MLQRPATIAFVLGLVVMVGFVGAVADTRRPYLMAQETAADKPKSPPGESQAGQKPAAPTYADIAEIVAKHHCTVCHGPVEPRDGLSLDTYQHMMRGGKDGPVIKPGEPDKSELMKRLKGISQPRMPFTGPPWLSDNEIQTVERWIATGAPEGKK